MEKTTLDKVYNDVIEWRKTKKSICERMPEQIWQSIRQIHKYYKKEDIIKKLGLKSSRYNEEVESNIDKNITKPSFFTIQPSDLTQSVQQKSVILKRVDGLTLSINNFTNEHLNSLITMFKQ